MIINEMLLELFLYVNRDIFNSSTPFLTKFSQDEPKCLNIFSPASQDQVCFECLPMNFNFKDHYLNASKRQKICWLQLIQCEDSLIIPTNNQNLTRIEMDFKSVIIWCTWRTEVTRKRCHFCSAIKDWTAGRKCRKHPCEGHNHCSGCKN